VTSLEEEKTQAVPVVQTAEEEQSPLGGIQKVLKLDKTLPDSTSEIKIEVDLEKAKKGSFIVSLQGWFNVTIYQDDITNEKVDAITNAANEGLMHGAGVAGAIMRSGG
jgi:hypothetical protein